MEAAGWRSGWGWDYWEVMALGMGFMAGFLTTLPTTDIRLPMVTGRLLMGMVDTRLTGMGTSPLIRQSLPFLQHRWSSSSNRRSCRLRQPPRPRLQQLTIGIIVASLKDIIPTLKIVPAAGCR